jgi:hypothetical protein
MDRAVGSVYNGAKATTNRIRLGAQFAYEGERTGKMDLRQGRRGVAQS